jgi:hypothetical protein
VKFQIIATVSLTKKKKTKVKGLTIFFLGRHGSVYCSERRGDAFCPMSVLTLRADVERAIIKAVPEVKRVEGCTLFRREQST